VVLDEEALIDALSLSIESQHRQEKRQDFGHQHQIIAASRREPALRDDYVCAIY